MRVRSVLSAALVVVGLAAAAPVARAAIVERVVAVVGEQPILLTELRQRARPFLIRMYAQVPVAQQKIEEARLYKELLQKLVDERVVSMAADKLNVTVTTKEVDEAVKLKAADLKIPISELLSEAAKQGLSESDYREEVRRELLFGKMLETRVRSRVRPTEDDARDYYKKLQVEERKQQVYRPAMIALTLGDDLAQNKAARALADQIVKEARAGADFGALAKKHSADPSRASGGDLGYKTPSAFGKAIDDPLLRVDPGHVSEPLVSGNRILIFKIIERPKSQLPPYAEVKDLVFAKVREDMLQKQIKLWLEELKSGVYIDIRL